MQRRQGWLFPMMVVAAASIIAFGCIGIAAITGHLPLTPPATGPLDSTPAKPSTLVTADALARRATADSAPQGPAAAAPTQDRSPALGGQPIVQN